MSYEIMIKEMIRERKYEFPTDPLTPKASDFRNYLLIDIDFYQNIKGERNVIPAVCLVSDTTQWYDADHNRAVRKGPYDRAPRRMTIELPPGTMFDDLATLKILAPLLDSPDSFVEIHSIQQIAVLDENYTLRVHPFKWQGSGLKIEQEKPRKVRFDLRAGKMIVSRR